MRSHTLFSHIVQGSHPHLVPGDDLELIDVTNQSHRFKASDNHETVIRGISQSSGLDALIAIHDTTLGPALGGCRIWPYANMDDAMEDVLRLSTGMSYKAAIAGLPLGGGKVVINCDPHKDKTKDLLRALGHFVDQLGGAYTTAEDVGTTVADMDIVAETTDHVLGRNSDPSPDTARGVIIGMQAALKHCFDNPSLTGITVAVQGLGKVGMALCEQLHEAGADLIVSDLWQPALQEALDRFGAKIVSPEKILRVQADILAPCAMGAVLNEKTIPMLRTPIVAGSANNQLHTDRDGIALHHAGIVYAPDYVINSGGLISAYLDMPDAVTDLSLNQRLARIGERLREVFTLSKAESIPTNQVADRVAKNIIDEAKHAHKARG
ncbi:MAG: amino acid dehydrogenase [Magnetovibrio sp.]|nr:amino acid dehydrogenase [Magnetovibrio sp.]